MIFANEKLPVNEYFYSLQGEGAYTGCAALFVRLAGCNVCCPWCDSPDSWSVDNGRLMDSGEVCDLVDKFGASRVIITGGEPALHNLTEVTNRLRNKGVKVHLETSGSERIVGDFDWITLSPKKFKECKEENYALADELKVIIESKEDIAWAEKLQYMVKENCMLFLQCEWSAKGDIYPILIEYIKKNNHWRLSIQTHKYLGIE